jgi:hypothetical protein
MDPARRFDGRQVVMDRFGTALPGKIIVYDDDPLPFDGRIQMRKAIHGRFIPISIEP